MKVIIITGERGEGKTTFLKKTAMVLRARGKSIFGFYAVHKIDSQKREGYELQNVMSDKHILLCKRDMPDPETLHLLDFWFNKGSIKTGENWLRQGFENSNPVFILDEAGKFELDGFVWDSILKEILNNDKGTLIVAVRNKFVKQIIENYKLDTKDLKIINKLLFTVEFTDKI